MSERTIKECEKIARKYGLKLEIRSTNRRFIGEDVRYYARVRVTRPNRGWTYLWIENDIFFPSREAAANDIIDFLLWLKEKMKDDMP